MFTGARSKRLVLVAHCLLNQNAKLDRCAFYPGAIRETTQAVIDTGAGTLQMPCPEMICLGLNRGADPALQPSVEEEDTRIADRLTSRPCMSQPPWCGCTGWQRTLPARVEQYRRYGFILLGVLGING